MALIGYARVSTDDQNAAQQASALAAAGCATVVRETASGASRARPELARLLASLMRGDVLVVVRIDRLARSLAHLLAIVADLEARGAGFRSLADPIDTITPQGRFALQILGAVAEFERALIAERTRAGLARAAAQGRRGGNPGLRAGDPLARAAISAGRTRARLDMLRRVEGDWLPAVTALRPDAAWTRVAAATPGWSAARLRAATQAYVRAGRLDAALLAPAPRRPAPDRRLAMLGATDFHEHALRVVAALKRAEPGMTNRALAARLDRDLGPPRRGAAWAESSVRALLTEARRRAMTS